MADWLIQSEAFEDVARFLYAQIPDGDLSAFADVRTHPDTVAFVVAEDGVATFAVDGPLLPERSPMLEFFGVQHTSYRDIRNTIAELNADQSVTAITMRLNSPGGQVSGLFETMAAVKNSAKPVSAQAELATSAAYGLGASASGGMTAMGVASTFGSVGVATSYKVSGSTVEITNTDSPDKRPDMKTEEGQAVVRAHLDEIFDVFASAIADGRGTSDTTVRKTFGGGRQFLAAEAQRRGMIDGIRSAPGADRNNKTAVEAAERKAMDVSAFKAQHPGVYAEVIKLGANQEHERVLAHLTLGEESGALETAHTAIREGSDLTPSLQAKYISAGFSKRDRDSRSADDTQAAAAIDGADAKPAKTEEQTEAQQFKAAVQMAIEGREERV